MNFDQIAQSASGLLYLHEHDPGLIHGDIKPENIVVDRGLPSFIDFGLSAAMENDTESTPRGTLLYASPHTLRGCRTLYPCIAR